MFFFYQLAQKEDAVSRQVRSQENLHQISYQYRNADILFFANLLNVLTLGSSHTDFGLQQLGLYPNLNLPASHTAKNS